MKIVSYSQLVVNENGKNIKKGMNFAIQKTYSVLLMSTEETPLMMMRFLMMRFLMMGLLSMRDMMYLRTYQKIKNL